MKDKKKNELVLVNHEATGGPYWKSILTRALGVYYMRELEKHIKRSDEIGSMTLQEFVKKHREIEEKILNKASKKLKTTSEPLDSKEEKECKQTVSTYRGAIALVKPLLNALSGLDFIPKELANTLLNSFSSTVSIDGVFTKTFVKGTSYMATHRIKKTVEHDNTVYEMLYVDLRVSANVKRNFFLDESEIEVMWTLRSKKFNGIASISEWVST